MIAIGHPSVCSKVGDPTKGLIKMYDTFPERCVPGAVPGVGFQFIDSVVLCLQSLFEVGTSFLAFQVKTMRVSCSLT